MKKVLFTLTFCAFATLIFAQSAPTKAEKAASITEAFDLNASQQGLVNKALENRSNAFAEAASFKETDPQTYLNKINIATEMYYMQIRNILSEEQKEAYPGWVKENGKKKAALEKQLREEGVSDLDIKIRIAELD
ncbi:MAG: hypothetical protein KDC24_13770 [Saprospiraceae bacterium]|nr:hypothetical protein [Saprospiraceae bacterium]